MLSMKDDVSNAVTKINTLINNSFYTDKVETVLSIRDLPSPDI